MARIITPLTPSKINAAKPEEKLYTMFDGQGLLLEVTPIGSKRWRIKYSFNGKTYKKSLGAYPATTLAHARRQRDKARGDIAEGRDPFPKEVKPGESNAKTFKWFTEWYFNGDPGKKKDVAVSSAVSEGHIKQTKSGWDNKVLPFIGEKDMTAVTAADIVKIIQEIKSTPELARKIYASISRLYSLSIANYPDEVTANPCAGIKIGDILVGAKQKNYQILTSKKDLKKLFIDIENYDKPKPRPDNATKPKRGSTSVKRLLTLLEYTFVRPKNAREALWSEFDLDAATWTISADKMKSRREHIVPLATQVVSMLKEWKAESTHDRVLPGQSGGNSTIGTAAPAQALHRMGYDIVAHSFRGIFATLANEENDQNDDVYSYAAIETQLAHVVGDKTSRAYNRSLYLKERTKMMQWYADHIDGIKNG